MDPVVKIEDLKPGYVVGGLNPAGPVKVKSIRQFSDRGVEVVYVDHEGNLGSSFFLADQQPVIELIWGGGS
jgi:hypothetical protein